MRHGRHSEEDADVEKYLANSRHCCHSKIAMKHVSQPVPLSILPSFLIRQVLLALFRLPLVAQPIVCRDRMNAL